MLKKDKSKAALTLHNIDDIINDHIPASALQTIGHAFKNFTTEDIVEIGSTILKEDLAPLLQELKISANAIKGKGHFLLNYAYKLGFTVKAEGLQNLVAIIKTDAWGFFNKPKKEETKNFHQTIILIPETKKRLTEFMQNISRDYSLLESDEEKGKYILKLSAYASIFIIAFQSGAGLSNISEQKNFIRKILLPVLVANGSLTLINRTLEQAEKKISHNPEALSATREIRKFVKIVNMGIESGMTLQAIADGLLQSKIVPKGKVNALVHSTVLAFFKIEKIEQ